MKYALAVVTVVVVLLFLRKKKMEQTTETKPESKYQFAVDAIPANVPPQYISPDNMIPSTPVVVIAQPSPNGNQIMQMNPAFQTNVNIVG